MTALFSIPAFFIVLREVLEACLVVGIALAYFSKTGNIQYQKWVWIGAAAGVVVSLACGIAFAIVYFVNDNQIFEDDAEKIFEGITFLLAAALLTWMIVWLMYIGKELRSRLESDLEAIIENDNKSPGGRKLGVFLMVFLQVLREGIETFIFLFGSANTDDDGWRAIPIPGILAIIVGIVVSYLVFKGLVSLDIQLFFTWSSFILIAFAAGLVSHAFHELQEVDWFGSWDRPEGGHKDWYNEVMWNTKRCCHDKENEFFAMLRALFGYQDTPTFVEWVTYFAYWIIIIGLYVMINWQQIRASRKVTYARTNLLSSLSLLFTFVGFIFVLLNRTWIGLLTMIIAFILSIFTVALVSDPIMKLFPGLGASRAGAVKGMAFIWGVHTFLMVTLHFVQLICEGDRDGCSINKFFFFGLIFDTEFRNMGFTNTEIEGFEKQYWPSIAVLSISLVITTFFFGGLTFRLFLMAMNIDEDGDYMHEEYLPAKEADEVLPAKEADEDYQQESQEQQEVY